MNSLAQEAAERRLRQAMIAARAFVEAGRKVPVAVAEAVLAAEANVARVAGNGGLDRSATQAADPDQGTAAPGWPPGGALASAR